MTEFFMLLVGLVIGVPAGAYLLRRRLSPQLTQAREQYQEVNAKWLELISMLNDGGQLPEGAAARILQLAEPSPAEPAELTKRSGKSDDRRIAEIARIRAGQSSLDSLEDMKSEDVRMVLMARIKAKRPLQHSLERMKSDDRRIVEVACAEAGIVL